MKRALILLLVILAGCAQTEYLTYQGSPVYVGTGGAKKTINGVDLWITGSPPFRFVVIGYISDSRFGGPLAMAGRDAGMAAQARAAGGDGLILQSDQMNFMGTYSTGSAFGSVSGNTLTVTGSSTSMPIIVNIR